MTRSVSLTPLAQRDLLRLVEFLTPNNPRAAKAAFRAISGGLTTLGSMPERGRKTGRSELREIRVGYGRDGYVILFRIDPDAVIVARIFHAREMR